MKTRIAAAVLTLAATLAALGGARADEPKKAEAGRLTVEALGQMLDDLGYEYKVSKTEDGKRTFYGLVIKQDTFTYVVDLSLDPAGQRVWFSCPLRKVPEQDRVKAERLW